MSTLVLSHAEVETLLPMGECIEVMAAVLAERARGGVYQPLRTVVEPPEVAGVMALMPAYRYGAQPQLGLKVVCVFPANPTLGLDSHQGTVTLFDGHTGQPQAIMSAGALTAIRTAAVSALATRLLARADAHALAIIGAGTQARTHIEALMLVRDFTRIQVYAPTRAHSHRLIADQQRMRGDEVELVATDTPEAALRGADVVVTATNSRLPVLRREWLADGAHINAIGASQPIARELDSATVADAALFVDSRESTINEAGEYQQALREGAIAGPEHIRAELGELVLGAHPGRGDERELTLFRSLGLAAEDLAAAVHVLVAARRAGAGIAVEL